MRFFLSPTPQSFFFLSFFLSLAHLVKGCLELVVADKNVGTALKKISNATVVSRNRSIVEGTPPVVTDGVDGGSGIEKQVHASDPSIPRCQVKWLATKAVFCLLIDRSVIKS